MLILVGTNHKVSPIEIREKLSFSKNKLKEALVYLLSYQRIKAGVILSTCNRVELYIDASDIGMGISQVKGFLSDYHKQELSEIEPYLYTYIGKEAILHLFCVSCGLDSQIIGESQILEQVRFAYAQAKIVESTDSLLDVIFNAAIKNSLKVRQETGISRGEISLASVVTELIKTKYTFLDDKKILIIGVGDISELVSRYLKKEKIRTTFVSNRSYNKAVQLAKDVDGVAVKFDKLKEKLKEMDVIISATSSPHLILKKNDILRVLKHKPVLIIDLALPRDVESTVKYIKGIELFNLDDLGFIIKKNLCKREQEIPIVLEIIKKDTEDLCLTESLELAPEPVPLP